MHRCQASVHYAQTFLAADLTTGNCLCHNATE